MLYSYPDITVFYNYLNDTIYHVKSTRLEPAWIIHLDPEYKLPQDYFYSYNKLLSEAARLWQQGKLEEAELIKITDGKPLCVAAYETSRYLFLIAINIKHNAKHRGIKTGDKYVIYYDKHTGKVRTTAGGDGFQDDLLGLPSFLPLHGAFRDKLVRILQPHELFQYMEEYRESGKEIDPRLLELSTQVKEGDNPILVLGHLKK